jgi:hypothetical protein
MKREQKKLSLNRDTIMSLTEAGLKQAGAAGTVQNTAACSFFVSCVGCNLTRGTCVICGTATTNLC